MDEDGEIEGRGILEGSAHHLGAVDWPSRVADPQAAGKTQCTHLRQPLAVELLGKGPDDFDPRLSRLGRPLVNQLDHCRGIYHGVGIRWGAESGNTGLHRSSTLALDGPLVL